MPRNVNYVVGLRESETLVPNLGADGGGKAGGGGDGNAAELAIHAVDVVVGVKIKGVDASTRIVGESDIVGAANIPVAVVIRGDDIGRPPVLHTSADL